MDEQINARERAPCRTRRALLIGLAGALAATAAPAAGAASRQGLTGCLATRGSAARLGAAVAAHGLVRGDTGHLQARLSARLAAFGVAEDAADPVRIRRGLSALMRRDFAAGDLVVLEGWALSRTETELYALVWAEAQDGA